MQTKVTFRHFKGQHPELHNAAIDAADNFEKFYDGIISTDVEFINEANKIVDIKVHVQGSTLVAKEESEDFHKSLNEASNKIERQIKKWKTKHLNNRA